MLASACSDHLKCKHAMKIGGIRLDQLQQTVACHLYAVSPALLVDWPHHWFASIQVKSWEVILSFQTNALLGV